MCIIPLVLAIMNLQKTIILFLRFLKISLSRNTINYYEKPYIFYNYIDFSRFFEGYCQWDLVKIQKLLGLA